MFQELFSPVPKPSIPGISSPNLIKEEKKSKKKKRLITNTLFNKNIPP